MRAAVTSQARSAWAKKLGRLVAAQESAAKAVLVGVYEAREAGLSQADIAYMIGDASSSTVAAKVDKGAKIAQERAKTS